MSSMTVGDLRRAIEGVDDALEIVVRAWDDDGGDVCGCLSGAEVQHAHDENDTPFFALDCCPEEESPPPGDGRRREGRPAVRVTKLELKVLRDVAEGRDPWRFNRGRTRTVSGAIGRLQRKKLVDMTDQGDGSYAWTPTNAGRELAKLTPQDPGGDSGGRR